MANTRFQYLQAGVRYVDENGFFSQAFRVYWQDFVDNLDASLTSIEDQQTTLEAQQVALDAANDAIALTTSFTIPTQILTASDTGTVTIAAHIRHYGDATNLSVAGGSIPGISLSTDVAFYYDDPTHADTTPSYQHTTDLASAQNNYVEGRHYVGALTTPASGAGPKKGGLSPPGAGYDMFGTGFRIL